MIGRNPILRFGFFLCLCMPLLNACSKETPEPLSPPATATNSTPAAEPVQPPVATAAIEDQTPPAPPLFEDFQGSPQISLFPRVGDFRPEDEEVERLPFWRTFIDHLSRVSGVVESKEDGNRAWSLRSIETVDSIAWFAPLAVEPNTAYRVSLRMRGDLPEQASAGIGVLEFDKFHWLGEQYPESLFKESYRKTEEGIRLRGKFDWRTEAFSFTTGPDSRMIHLVLFREGAPSRSAVQFDDLRIEPAR